MFTDKTDSQYNKLVGNLVRMIENFTTSELLLISSVKWFYFFLIYQSATFFKDLNARVILDISVCQRKGFSICIPWLHWHSSLQTIETLQYSKRNIMKKSIHLRHFLKKYFLFTFVHNRNSIES